MAGLTADLADGVALLFEGEDPGNGPLAEGELLWRGIFAGQAGQGQGLPRRLAKLKLFRVVVNTHRTEWIVTNDLPRDSARAAQKARRLRWKIEELYRESKQLTGIERCQCSSGRIQLNHISCSLLVWSHFKHLAYQSGQTVYRIKRGLLHDYLVQQLKNPSVQMVFA